MNIKNSTFIPYSNLLFKKGFKTNLKCRNIVFIIQINYQSDG